MMSKSMGKLFYNPKLYTTALKFAPLANHLPSFIINIKLNAWAYGHRMMTFPKQSFHALWKSGEIK